MDVERIVTMSVVSAGIIGPAMIGAIAVDTINGGKPLLVTVLLIFLIIFEF